MKAITTTQAAAIRSAAEAAVRAYRIKGAIRRAAQATVRAHQMKKGA